MLLSHFICVLCLVYFYCLFIYIFYYINHTVSFFIESISRLAPEQPTPLFNSSRTCSGRRSHTKASISRSCRPQICWSDSPHPSCNTSLAPSTLHQVILMKGILLGNKFNVVDDFSQHWSGQGSLSKIFQSVRTVDRAMAVCCGWQRF